MSYSSELSKDYLNFYNSDTSLNSSIHPYQVNEQKIIPSGISGDSSLNQYISLSGDGNYLAIGGSHNNSFTGETWVYIRSGSTWTLQATLVGTGNTGTSRQGSSVSLNSDGTYLAVGGSGDNTNVGATWIFTRSGTSWSQQAMLIGSGYTGSPEQGQSVSLNSDATYLAVGGPNDNNRTGATWIFTRSGTSWTQQAMLIGTPSASFQNQGYSISLNSDATYLAIGTPGGGGAINPGGGSVFIFTRSGTSWSQQTNIISDIYSVDFGTSVSLNSDATYLVVGDPSNNYSPSYKGAVTIFIRSGSSWSLQQVIYPEYLSEYNIGESVSINSDASYMVAGTNGYTETFKRYDTSWRRLDIKLGLNQIGISHQGTTVSIDGNGVYVGTGGPNDNSNIGAVWVFDSPYPSSLLIDTSSGQYSLTGASISSNIVSTYINTDQIISTNINANNYTTNGTGDVMLYLTAVNATVGSLISTNSQLTNTTISNLLALSSTSSNLLSSSTTTSNLKITGQMNILSNTISSSSATFKSLNATNPIYGFISGTGTQSIPNTTWTKLTSSFFNGTLSTSGGLSYTNGTFIIPQAGYYIMSYNVGFAANATGARSGQIVINGNTTGYYAFEQIAPGPDVTSITGTICLNLHTSSTIDLYVYQSSGLSLSMDTTTNSYFEIVKLNSSIFDTYVQLGSKLVGTGYTGSPEQGTSVSLSGDGNYLAIGGPFDNSNIGATWIFTKSNGIWSQQTILIGTGNTGASKQGYFVSLNSDGTYLAIGGPGNNSNIGATWIFTRSGTSWSQQTMLIGTGNTGASQQGWSVSLNSDATYLAIGGPYDNSSTGATWIFTRSVSSWSQQAILIGTGYTDQPVQGSSVSFNTDATYIAIGGPGNTNTSFGSVGATWIFTRSGTSWSQQAMLVSPDWTDSARQGNSVSFNSNSTYLAIGGYNDVSGINSTWIFTRSGTSWNQIQRLVDSTNNNFGYSVSLTPDGIYLAVGGPTDNTNVGAAWIYTR